MFPQKTYEKMLQIIQSRIPRGTIYKKWLEINFLMGKDKKNRWFGYYQKLGEDIGLWTLEEVKKWVRDEKK